MDLAIVVYTNETNIPILKLYLQYFFKYNPNYNFSIYVVANNFTKEDLPYKDKVKYLSGNVEWDFNGRHFAKTLLNTLSQINEEYIFYFCEDYILTDPIDIKGLNNLIQLIKDENIDLFSFGSTYSKVYNRPILNIDYTKYEFEPDIFYHLNNDYEHAFSVQPCIWKKSSLIKLLQDNPGASLHDMDCSELKNKDIYKIICTGFYIYDLGYDPEYFIIGYKEVIRYGVFLVSFNGHEHLLGTHGDTFIKQMIKENNLIYDSEYDKYIGFDKNLLA